MSLTPSTDELRARARADLRMGLPVALADGPQEGAAGALAIPVEMLSPARLATLRGLGSPVLALTARRAATLRAQVYDGDVARIALPASADLRWLNALADPEGDLKTPMKGPLRALRGGSAALHRAAIALSKESRLLPAALLVELPDIHAVAEAHGLTALAAADASPTAAAIMSEVVSARLPLTVSEHGRLHVFRPDDGGEEHYAVEIGSPDRTKPVLSRLHSACFTGDLLGSLKCDCGPQLRGALEQMGAEGAGILLYLNQEGRGIGLANKMRAYSLQDQGFDTVEANHRLGFEDDERDFRLGATLLRELGFSSARLLTNNPAKVAMLESNGIQVTERVPLKVGHSHHNAHYLATKAAKSGHLL